MDNVNSPHNDNREIKNGIIDQIKAKCHKNLSGFLEEIDPTQTADLFVELADTISADNTDPEHTAYYRGVTQQAVLLEAALRRTKDQNKIQQIQNKIRSLCCQILSYANSQAANQNHDIIKTTKSIKERLDLMRKNKDLLNLKKIPKVHQHRNIQKQPEQIDQERVKIAIVDEIMKDITNDYTQLMKNISNQCIEMLGPPPCSRFAHVAMGSLSRSAVTYYSDFENAIVFEDTISEEELLERKRFFRCYAVLFEIIVIGFGETPIRLAGIEGLNDFYSENKAADWFWDSVTPNGVRFDSQMPFASKKPFARLSTVDKQWEVELIGTKSHMLHYLTEDCVLKEGYHLAEMLSSTSFVAGSFEFYKEFSHDANQTMNTTFQSRETMEQMLKEYEQNIVTFSVYTEIEKYGSKLSVKQMFYRSFSVFYLFLERLTGVNGSLSFGHTVEQWKKDGMEASVVHNLHYALCLANEARLKLYSKKMEQSDIVSGTKHVLDSSSGTGVFSVLDTWDVVTSFEIGLQWNKALVEIRDKIKQGKADFNTKMCVIGYLNQFLQSRNDLYSQGLILQHFQEYDKAVETYEQVLDTSSDNVTKLNAYKNLGKSCIFALNPKKAAENYKAAIAWFKSQNSDQFQDHDLADLLDWLGQSYSEFDHKLAEESLKESREMWCGLLSSDSDNTTYLKGMGDVNDSLGWLYYRMTEFEKSLESYEEAEKTFETLKLKSPKMDLENLIINVKNGIHLCYHGLKRYEEAIKQGNEVMKVKKKMLGEDTAVLHISYTKRKIASCYMELGNFERAIEEYEEALRIRKACVGNEIDKKASYGFIKGETAECYFRMEDFEMAIKTAEESFLIGHEISTSAPSSTKMMRAAIGVVLKANEKIIGDADGVALKNQLVHSTVKKILQILENSFYDNKLNEEKVKLQRINRRLNRVLQPEQVRENECWEHCDLL